VSGKALGRWSLVARALCSSQPGESAAADTEGGGALQNGGAFVLSPAQRAHARRWSLTFLAHAPHCRSLDQELLQPPVTEEQQQLRPEARR
jgi:hypothetical protein